jgi:hypothetical protein
MILGARIADSTPEAEIDGELSKNICIAVDSCDANGEVRVKALDTITEEAREYRLGHLSKHRKRSKRE